MTIRIHEADGTPYEHIVEIKEAMTKFDIPYNTKYKRLKRSRRQKERTAGGPAIDFSADAHDDVLLYSLGDVLQSEEEIRSWRLVEWGKEDEERMSQESYEWIRMDADFEWICKMSIAMPGYMYQSQLQQDRDVVAQLEVVLSLEISYLMLTASSPFSIWQRNGSTVSYLLFLYVHWLMDVTFMAYVLQQRQHSANMQRMR